MAKIKKVTIKATDEKEFLVIKKFNGNINGRPFTCALGDSIMLNTFEADCLKTYIKEQE
jgi:hypothetical protein